MLTVYYGSGARDFSLLRERSLDEWDNPRCNAIRYLEAKAEDYAVRVLTETDFELWAVTNGFNDDFELLVFRVAAEQFVLLEQRLKEERALQEYGKIARALENFGLCVRFIAVDLAPDSAANTVAAPIPNPHRQFSSREVKKRQDLTCYLDRCSEDELILEVLLPLFRQLGFHRITAGGHKDKALEYGKDIWMKYTLPTQHILYFGLQVKKDKIDAAGDSKGRSRNIAEIHNQALMMLGHENIRPGNK